MRLESHTSLFIMASHERYDFSKTTESFRKKLKELADKSFKNETPTQYDKRNIEVVVDASNVYKMSDAMFVYFVFSVMQHYGRCFKDATDLPLAVKKAEYLFNMTTIKSQLYFRERIFAIGQAERRFATYLREEKQCHPVDLPSEEARKAVCMMTCMLVVPTHMGKHSNVTNILHAQRVLISALTNESFQGNWGHMSTLASRVRDYFVLGGEDKKMLEMEHFAALILDEVFSGDLDPRNWRKIEPSDDVEQVCVSRTETFAGRTQLLRVLATNHVSRGTQETIVRSMETIEDAVVMFVYDVPWFMVHANFASLVDDLPHKVIHCGGEFAMAVVVASAETLDTWRMRATLVSGCIPTDSTRVYDMVDAFWSTDKTRSLLLRRLWTTATDKSVEPFGFADPDSMHYQCFYCLMPVLVTLTGKEMAAAIAVDAPREFDLETARELADNLEGASESISVHRGSLGRLRSGDASRVDMLYAMVMDPGLDEDWRKALATFLADSMVWPEGAVFEKARQLIKWPTSGRFEHVSDQVAFATVNSIRSGKVKTVHNIGLENVSDVFYYPKSYNKEQTFVRMRTSSLIDVAYAYHMFPDGLVEDPCVIKATRPPSVRTSLAVQQLEPMYAAYMTGKEYNFDQLTDQDRTELAELYEQARHTPIMTPTAHVRLPVFQTKM
jgi:hypothetical protein